MTAVKTSEVVIKFLWGIKNEQKFFKYFCFVIGNTAEA